MLVSLKKSKLLDFKKERKFFFCRIWKKNCLNGWRQTLSPPPNSDHSGRGKKSKWTEEKERKKQREMVGVGRDYKSKRETKFRKGWQDRELGT